MNTTETSDLLTLSIAGREKDRRLILIVTPAGGGEAWQRGLWPRDRAEVSEFLNALCAQFPGVGPAEKSAIRRQVNHYCKAERIDIEIHSPHGPINGSARVSIDYWQSSRIAWSTSGNLLSPKFRADAAAHLARLEAGPGSRPRRLRELEEEIRQRFVDEINRLRHVANSQPRPKIGDAEAVPFEMAPNLGTYWHRPGLAPAKLCNFIARITANISRTDGVNMQHDIEIEAQLPGKSARRFIIRGNEFEEMQWPIRELGAGAIVESENGYRAKLRVAIQKLSTDVDEKMLYVHTGWMRREEHSCFLHGGGAISAEKDPPKIEVALHPALARYVLPDPPEGAAIGIAARASLKLLELGPLHVMLPGYCAIWRSVLGPCDCGVFTVGPSGAFKSELMALRLQHFGAGLDRMHLPANFSSTANALELLAFAAKDALLGVDDFAPCGNRNQIDALHATAERLFRAQGNQSGRQRSSREGEVGASRPPRGMILATGEDVPRGKSLRARVMVEEIAPGDISPAMLTACQHDARDGLYAAVNAAYLRWLCPRLMNVQKNLAGRMNQLRDRAMMSGSHRRTPEVVANLLVGLMHFIEFATESEAVTRSEADDLWTRAWAAMGEAAARQNALQADNDPAHRFIELLTSAMLSGEAYLSDADGNAPDDEIAAGVGWWRRTSSSAWEPRGIWAGIIDQSRDIYLEFDAAFRAAQRAAGGADGLMISAATLRKRLHEGGHLQGADRTRTAVRKRVKGAIRMMICLAPGSLGGIFARTARTASSAVAENPVFEPPRGKRHD